MKNELIFFLLQPTPLPQQSTTEVDGSAMQPTAPESPPSPPAGANWSKGLIGAKPSGATIATWALPFWACTTAWKPLSRSLDFSPPVCPLHLHWRPFKTAGHIV